MVACPVRNGGFGRGVFLKQRAGEGAVAGFLRLSNEDLFIHPDGGESVSLKVDGRLTEPET